MPDLDQADGFVSPAVGYGIPAAVGDIPETPKSETREPATQEQLRIEAELTSKQRFGVVRRGKPMFTDQRVRYPHTVTYGAIQMAVFNLPAQLEALNALMQRTHPDTAPEIDILQSRIEFSPTQGTFHNLVTYRELQYILFDEPVKKP